MCAEKKLIMKDYADTGCSGYIKILKYDVMEIENGTANSASAAATGVGFAMEIISTFIKSFHKLLVFRFQRWLSMQPVFFVLLHQTPCRIPIA
jgi:hypothetical protein